eukprot:scaffold241_cov234-Chaetoceros_neogracile.AAC.1
MGEFNSEDAVQYLNQIRMAFKDRPQIYDDFLHIMKTFKSKEINAPEAIVSVTHLFEGNRFLILGFNTFLPKGFIIEIPDHDQNGTVYYRIATSEQPIPIPIQHDNDYVMKQEQPPLPISSPTIDFDNAVIFGTIIKRTFANDPSTHNKFLKILESYHSNQHGVQEVLDEMFVLFADHPVLMRDFVFYFLAR